jgi:hypothetical protein
MANVIGFIFRLPGVIAWLDPQLGLPTSALNCRDRKHPISMQSNIPGQWLLDRPVTPGDDDE